MSSFWTRQDRVAAKEDALKELRDVAADGKITKKEAREAGKKAFWRILSRVLLKRVGGGE